MLNCSSCGQFFRYEPGVAWQMVYSGYPRTPDREIYRCKRCVAVFGEFIPQSDIRPEYSCGIVQEPPQ